MRTLWITFQIDEQSAGGLLADLANRVTELSFGVVEAIPHFKNQSRKMKDINNTKPIDPINTGLLTVDDMKKIMLNKGYSSKSYSSWVIKQVKLGYFKRVKRGLYKVEALGLLIFQ